MWKQCPMRIWNRIDVCITNFLLIYQIKFPPSPSGLKWSRIWTSSRVGYWRATRRKSSVPIGPPTRGTSFLHPRMENWLSGMRSPTTRSMPWRCPLLGWWDARTLRPGTWWLVGEYYFLTWRFFFLLNDKLTNSIVGQEFLGCTPILKLQSQCFCLVQWTG